MGLRGALWSGLNPALPLAYCTTLDPHQLQRLVCGVRPISPGVESGRVK